MYRVEQIKFAS